MNGLEALLLGLVQGLSEFFPISSSGHLVLAQALLGIRQEGLLFEVVVHVATLASVLIFYRQRVGELVLGVLGGRAEAIRYVAKLALATVPAVATVLLIGDFLESQFESPRVAALCLLVTGAIVWTTRSTAPAAAGDEPSWLAAFLIGCGQAFAILPGISRSGTTVAVALALGVRPVAAAEFSFLMSVIAITGAAARAIPDLAGVSTGAAGPMALGFAAALGAGVAAIWLFVRMLRNAELYRFSYYTWVVGALALAWLTLGA